MWSSSTPKRNVRTKPRPAGHLGDDSLSLNHINQQIENLRPDGDLLGTSPKLAPVDIQDVVLKEKLHFDPPGRIGNFKTPQRRIGNFKQESGRF